MKNMNIALIGASSEIASSFIDISNQNGDNVYCVTSNSSFNQSCYKKLFVNDYLLDQDEILSFLDGIEDLTIIFFNGFLGENRSDKYPSVKEIEMTDTVNFVIPYYFTELFKNFHNINNFIYISSIAAVKPRYKNYIYGLTKRKLEESIKKIGLNKFLIIRFGKVLTKMSYEHRDPPFVMNSQQAAKFVYSNLDKSGVVYPKIGLFIVSLVLKAMPTKLIDRLNY
jgi:nucleoside-diphosphate-sugar epimerase